MIALLRFAEKVFTVLALLLFSKAVLLLVLSQNGSQAEGSALFQILWFSIYAITFCILALQYKGFTRIPKNLDFNVPILLLIGFAAFSFYWSNAPDLTLRRSVALAGSSLFGIYLAARYSPKEQLRLLAWTFGIGAVLSLLFAVLLPSYGLDVYPNMGAWRGVYVQKNSLGRAMTLSAVLFLLIAPSFGRYRWIAWFGFSLSTGLVVLSTSKTALLALLTLLILLPFYRALRWKYTASVPLFIISILLASSLAIWVTSEAETLLGYIGKDVTLTGRTELWEIVFTMILEHPWLGYGYSAFWTSLDYSNYIWEVIGWPAPHAHNGLLDLWLDLGIVGVILYLVSFLVALVKALAWVRYTQSSEYLWPILYLTFMLLVNLTQNIILSQNDIFWIMYVTISFCKPVQHYRPAKLPIGTIPNKGRSLKDVL